MGKIDLPPWEATAYEMLRAAAAAGEPCPTNLDIEMAVGCSSGSVPSKLVERLERRGLICVRRFQRFRWVYVVELDAFTRRPPSQHLVNPHVRRGCGAGSRSPMPSDRHAYRGARL